MTVSFSDFGDRLRFYLETLYPDVEFGVLKARIVKAIAEHVPEEGTAAAPQLWDETTTLVITYGDTLLPSQDEGDRPTLPILKEFLDARLDGVISGVHILPFFPYSSDDGFAVIDYLKVNPRLGTWDDVAAIAENFEVMADLVINHISSQSEWFQQFIKQEEPGCHYFIEYPPETDCHQVIRPRSSPLLTPVDTVNGIKYVWTTFSADQVDVNFANPDVLLEFINILLSYCRNGARFIRLDAVGFLWKRLNTPCIHLPETHFAIQLFREILAVTYPDTVLITETNVPNRENLSYFGRGNEAHMIYNFSLPPLLLNALIRGESKHLKTWMKSMPPAQEGCAYFNFTASHDGIGLRPAEGLIEGEEFTQLVKTIEGFGARINYRSQSDGTQRPYELNISLFDALKGTIKGEDKWQRQRFVCSQAIMMALEGVPAFYIHSLLATPNDYEKLEATGHNRSINRHQWDYAELCAKLDDPDSDQHWVFNELKRLISIRRQQKAFHPNATQYTLDFRSGSIFGLWRQSRDRRQSIFCIYNLSDRPKSVAVSNLNLICTDEWHDLLGRLTITEDTEKLNLSPYQIAWITNVPLLH
ncbi:sugar phosphorylase [[Limnothrix rosea] IAM M-220]|uniref:sugar phosphorylase n=1 Tax=[Limnothrix rosea] IAM M-220 TaxID=454133 RepID=UPI0009679BD3|nr:sugar phosphorylase [[Limnothrix rosea] IAM M-220]OKH18115.1 alpha-amylase [[Limnothrix rosea] IAM M-220]